MLRDYFNFPHNTNYSAIILLFSPCQSHLETDRAPEAVVVGQIPPHPADPGGHEALVRRQHAKDVQHGGVGAAEVRREVIPKGGLVLLRWLRRA